MPLYESRKNAENVISVKPEWRDALVIGANDVLENIAGTISELQKKKKRTVSLAFDGWFDIDWPSIRRGLDRELKKAGLKAEFKPVADVFKSQSEIRDYRRQFTETSDPGFGVVNTGGHIIDIIDMKKLEVLVKKLSSSSRQAGSCVTIVYGVGAAIPEFGDVFDSIFYFDKTRQPILWEMWDSKRFSPWTSGWTTVTFRNRLPQNV